MIDPRLEKIHVKAGTLLKSGTSPKNYQVWFLFLESGCFKKEKSRLEMVWNNPSGIRAIVMRNHSDRYPSLIKNIFTEDIIYEPTE